MREHARFLTTAVARLGELKPLLVALSVAGVLAGCGGSEDRTASHLARGAALVEAGDYEKARVEYKNVLQIDPKKAEGHIGLARTLVRLGQWREAAAHYLAAIEVDSRNPRPRLELARLFIAGSALDRAESQLAEVLAENPANPEARALMAATRLHRGNVDEASAEAEVILRASPDTTDALLVLAAGNARRGEWARAIDSLERAVSLEKRNASLRVELSKLHLDHGGSEARAISLLKEAADLEPSQPAYGARLAETYLRLQRAEEAEQVLRDAVSRRPDDDQTKLALIQLLAKTRDRKSAEQALREYIEQNRGSYALRFGLAQFFESGGEVEPAKQVYRLIISRAGKAPEGLEARIRLARLLAGQDSIDEARALVDQVLESNPKSGDALSLRADLALVGGKAADAIADYRAALRGQPTSVDLHLRLAQAHLANQDRQLAEEALRQAVAIEPQRVQARLQLAGLLARSERVDGAVAEIDSALQVSPRDPALLEAKARLLLHRRDWDGAAATATALQESFPINPSGYLLAGLAHGGQAKDDLAIAALQDAVRLDPKAAEPLMALVQILTRKDPDRALAHLESVISEQPRNALAWNLKGEILLLRKRQYAEAGAAFQKAIELSPTAAIAFRNAALAAEASGDIEGAEKTLREGLKATGGAIDLRLQLASLLEQRSRSDQAMAEYEAVLGDRPDSVVAANNLAMLLVSRPDAVRLKRARELASKLEGVEDPTVLDTVGWVRYKAGEFESAKAALERAVEKAPDVPIFRFHLGMAYYSSGDVERAREQISKALTSGQPFDGAREARALLDKLR